VVGQGGFYYYVFVAPLEDYARFRPSFEGIVNNMRFQK